MLMVKMDYLHINPGMHGSDFWFCSQTKSQLGLEEKLQFRETWQLTPDTEAMTALLHTCKL